MRLAFINANVAHDYGPDTVATAPLAGAESAQVHLARALADRGHDISLFVGTLPARRTAGIELRPVETDLASYRGFDAIFVTHHRQLSVEKLRLAVGSAPTIVAWEHDCFSPQPDYVERIAEIPRSKAWLACVSEWHSGWMRQTYPYLAPHLIVMRNAAASVFLDHPPPQDDVVAAKVRPTQLAFASTPYKGLDRVASVYRLLRETHPDCPLIVHSGFDHYPPNDRLRRGGGRWARVADTCRALPGVDWRGVVPAPALARTMRSAAILLYPNTFLETSSIVCMEAMAAGMAVLTHPNAALPETLAGFGFMLPAPALRDELAASDTAFARSAGALIDRFMADDPALAEHLRRQIDHARTNYRWSVRAAEAETLIARLAADR